MKFLDLKLINPIIAALDKMSYNNPTPIQQQAIPYILEGRDLFGCAQTGTGKTAAFALPI
jgi:ATP-dependent RNA helicase RhlE